MIYLNNATTGWPKRNSALERFQATMTASPSDIRHSSRPLVEQCREQIADLLKQSPDDIFFVTDATSAINCVLRGYLRDGDHCIADNRQHNAVVRTLHAMPKVLATYVDLYDINDQPQLEPLKQALDERTRLICLSHTSNVTGSVFDLSGIVPIVRKAAPNAAIFIDASQSAGSTDLEDALAAADFLVFPSHKHLMAPPGAALLIARRTLTPVIYGGTGRDSSRREMIEHGRNFTEVGTANVPAIAALVTALQEDQQKARWRNHAIAERCVQIWEGLQGIKGVRPLGRYPGLRRNGTIAALVPGSAEHEWVPFLAAEGVIVRGGYHCCPHFHESAPEFRRGTLRISPSIFTDKDDIENALTLIASFASFAS